MATTELTLQLLKARVPSLAEQWQRARPFPYLVADDFLGADLAESLLENFPGPDHPSWVRKTFTHQREKLVMNEGLPPAMATFFDLSASPEFRSIIEDITGIPQLLGDEGLEGGGLHQIQRGGFLDVHVDFNLHPKTKLHRRLNLLVYLNKEWADSYQGHLELWDMAAHERLVRVAPIFNRAVMFETNEISFHGHPAPLACPEEITRKSLAVYYYTAARDTVAPEHNTIYKQTTGPSGYVKTALSSSKAIVERARQAGLRKLGAKLADKAYRKLRGLPPRNG